MQTAWCSSLQDCTVKVLADLATTARQILSNDFVSSLQRALQSMVGLANFEGSMASTSSLPPKDSDSLDEIAQHILECEDGVLDWILKWWLTSSNSFSNWKEYFQEMNKEYAIRSTPYQHTETLGTACFPLWTLEGGRTCRLGTCRSYTAYLFIF